MGQFLGFGDGHDGDLTPLGDINTRTSCSGTSGSTTLTVSSTAGFVAGDRIIIHQTRGDDNVNWEDNLIITVGAGTLTLMNALDRTYTDSGNNQAQCVLMKQSRSVNFGTNFTVPSWDGNTGGIAGVICTGEVSGAATITLTGAGFRGGGPENIPAYQGECYPKNGDRNNAANAGGGGGGGGGSGKAGGGGGGYGTEGSSGTATGGGSGGVGGGTYGDADATKLHLGAGGGGATGTQGGKGGDGGGLLIIFARTFNFTGSFLINGEAGAGAGANDGGGGGGSGGGVLLKTINTTVGSNLIDATGGGGGSGGSGNGGAGGDGRVRIESCNAVSGTTDPAASEIEGGHEWCSVLGHIF